MGFAIFRMQKLKSHVAMKGSLKHSFREQNTPNADASLTPQNEHIGAASSQEAIQKYNTLIEKSAAATKSGKIRKNAVVACEFLITASPEVMNQKEKKEQDAYFQDALKWLEERHGKENIVCAGVHRDETTPHMYAYVVPRDLQTGKLNCRKFYGGKKDVMSKLQTEFHAQVGKKHDLERGLEGSKAQAYQGPGLLQERQPGAFCDPFGRGPNRPGQREKVFHHDIRIRRRIHESPE